MDNVIYKSQLSWCKSQKINGVLNPLYIAMQNDDLCLWYESVLPHDVDRGPTLLLERFGIGMHITDAALNYLGTIQNNGFVWHFYYKYIATK